MRWVSWRFVTHEPPAPESLSTVATTERGLGALAVGAPVVAVVWALVVSGPELAPVWFTLAFLVAHAPLLGYGIWTSPEVGERTKTISCGVIFVVAGALALLLALIRVG